MGGAEGNDDRTEIARMQAGIRAWVMRTASGSARGLRRIPPPALLSMLCASAFSPLMSVSAGLTGAAASAGFTVLSSVSGGALSGIIASALDRAHAHDDRPASASADLERELAGEISRILEAGDADAQALRAEIAAVLRAIDAGRTMLSAAIETGNDQVHRDLVAAVEVLGTGFAQMEFLISDVARAAAEVQQSLDEQAANVRVVVDQNNRQSADIRLVREGLGVIERRTRTHISGGIGGDQGPRWMHGCPYRGLLPFTEADAEVFYGRERLTTELVVQVARGGLLVVTGASGAGKSSLLRAGLLPALARGIQMEGSEHWPRIVMTPTRHPMTELATRLAALSGGDAVAARDSLARQPGQAHLAVRQAVLADAARGPEQRFSGRDATRLVLVVDQFEQVFTLNPGPHGEAERQAFIAALHAAATSPAGPEHEPPALVVIAVRGDFWDRCAAYPELAAALQDRQFVVGPMTETDLRLAITGPAEAAGLRIDAALTDTILSDLRAAGGDNTAGALPLLSQAMLLTWENRDGDTLTSRGYGKAGGVSLAVQTSADAAYDSLPAEQQMLARELLRAMTVASRDGRFTRRPVTRAALNAAHPAAGRPQVDAVLEAFADHRLVVLDADAAQISHDALLGAWPRLRGWLDADQASWILHGQLTDDAATWHDSKKDSSFLYRGTQLAALLQAAAGWESDPVRFPALTPGQRDFLQASEHAAARGSRQRRMLAGLLAILLIASVASAVIAAGAARNANHQRAEAVSGQLAAESEALDSADPVTASLLAAAAWRIAPTAQARDSMLDVIAQPDHGVLSGGSAASGVITLAFSPNGMLATASADGTARLWDPATRHQIGAPISTDPNVDTVAFSPDGKTLATASWDGEAQLWNVATHSEIGAHLTTGSSGNFSGTEGVNQDSAAFSPDGKILATVSAKGEAWLWDVATQAPIGKPFTTSSGRIEAVAFRPGSKTLATASSGGTVQLWNAATHAPIGAPLTTGSGGADAVTFSPDGKTLVTAGDGGMVRLWNVASHGPVGAPFTTSGGSEFGTAVAFSHDGKTLAIASGGGTTQLWDVATHHPIGAPLATGSRGLDSVALSPEDNILATTGQGGTARLWDLATRGQIGSPLASGTGVEAIAFSPDGKTLATASEDGTARLWDLATHTQNGLLAAGARDTGGVFALAFSPDGKILATIDAHGFHVKNTKDTVEITNTTVRLWDVATRSQIGAPLRIGSSEQGAVKFSPDGKTLATIDASGLAQLWDVATHQVVEVLTEGVTSGAFVGRDAVAFSPDGKTLATGSAEGTVRLWDVATDAQSGALNGRGDIASFARVGFSPDGRTLATWGGPGTARLWNVASRAQIGAPLSAGTGQVYAVAFGPDGKTVATAGLDGTARLWDVATHAQIGPPITTGTSPVYAVAFSPDGRTLATGSRYAVRLWNITLPGHILKAVCAIAGRSLTRLEWDTYIKSEPFQQVCP